MRLEAIISPRKVGFILGMIALYLAMQSLVIEYVEDQVADSDVNASFILAIDLFSVNAEQAIPTWYSAINLFIAAMLLWTIATAKRASHDGYVRYWVGLAAGFLYLSVDEGAVIHEVLADWLQNEFRLTGYLAFGWQIVAVPLVIVVGLLYLRFVFHLPPQTRNLFITAGALYVGGSVLLDAVSANQWDQDDAISFRYLTIGTLEELCEMLGVVVLIYALLAYMVKMRYTIAVHPPPFTQGTPESALHAPAVPVHSLGSPLQSFWLRPVAVLIVGLNLALLYWGSVQQPVIGPTLNPAVSVPVVLDQLVAAESVVVIRMPGRFIDNPVAHQVVAALLPQFDEVYVVTSASTGSSFALAADELPFDRNRLAEVLQANGETQFVIFETPAVKAIVSTTQTSMQSQ